MIRPSGVGEMGEFFFSPSQLTVPAGTDLTLVVTNDGEMPHDLQLGDGTGTPMLDPGESVEQAGLDLGGAPGRAPERVGHRPGSVGARRWPIRTIGLIPSYVSIYSNSFVLQAIACNQTPSFYTCDFLFF